MKSEQIQAICAVSIIIAGTLLLIKKKKRKPRRWWARPWLNQQGNLNLPEEFQAIDDKATYRNFLRMDEKTFNVLLNKIRHRIEKQNTSFRQAITAEKKLIVTLRYLATGESYRSLMYNYRISESAISIFIPYICRVIYEELKDEYLCVPKTVAEWLNIADDFERMWNIPNVMGALDGKHVYIKAPMNSGSLYYNYKGHHNIVLLALVNANYQFVYIDVGANGRRSDGSVFRDSSLCRALTRNLLNVPQDKPLPNRQRPMPYVVVADAAFPLTTQIMKPYPFRGLTDEQQCYNYRLSRARRVVENAFGILANRFRVLLGTNSLEPLKVKAVIQACCVLHNFLRCQCKLDYIPLNPDTDIDMNNILTDGLGLQAGNRAQNEAMTVREEFKLYFNNEGRVPWQNVLYK